MRIAEAVDHISTRGQIWSPAIIQGTLMRGRMSSGCYLSSVSSELVLVLLHQVCHITFHLPMVAGCLCSSMSVALEAWWRIGPAALGEQI